MSRVGLDLTLLIQLPLEGAGGQKRGTYKVVNSDTKIPCIILQTDITLYLSYYTTTGTEEATIHVPTTSTVDADVSSCDTIITTSNHSIKSQLLRINLDHMPGWSIDLAFTKDNMFKTEKGTEYTLFQINVTANYGSDPSSYPGVQEPIQHYYLPIDPNDLSDVSGSIYAKNGNSYYCPSSQKYAINKNTKYGPYAYIKFILTTLQAYKTDGGGYGNRETCPSDQRVTDLVPIIVGCSLAGIIVLTLIIYLIYRSCLPSDVINLVNPESNHAYSNEIEDDE
ncbi:unnamed protein product [Caenorhabditis bovis]|uniref:Uncharacterized protein n=1 Tax=Caenorhabditis bovis TaxID=2654633 RepID=A0A8S1EFR4_9PELO|nr:unnamed protein product [Caenorhabditis bovis]